jgi:SH3 domain protein
MTMIRMFAIAALGLFAAAAAAQEIAYVTDMLQLGLHRSADTSDAPFDNLASGTELVVLERSASYARVRTPGGQEGWVRTAFLVSETPARYRLAGMDAEIEALRGELARSRAARIGAEEETARLRRQAAGYAESLGAMQSTVSRLRAESESFQRRLERYRASVPLVWAAGALLVTLIGGFVGGVWWLDARIRRRHGGFRIY